MHVEVFMRFKVLQNLNVVRTGELGHLKVFDGLIKTIVQS